MRNNEVVIIDFGLSNLMSVEQAFKEIGVKTIVTSDQKIIKNAKKIVLPGVGAFKNAMKALNSLKLSETIVNAAHKRIPILGICLGMQLLFDESDEFGLTKGLGLIPGRVEKYPSAKSNIKSYKVPQINWHELIPSNNETGWKNFILRDFPCDEAVYFVHSFVAKPKNQTNRLADYKYGDNLISAVVVKDNIIGCQFHPEKSGEQGLKILRNFMKL